VLLRWTLPRSLPRYSRRYAESVTLSSLVWLRSQRRSTTRHLPRPIQRYCRPLTSPTLYETVRNFGSSRRHATTNNGDAFFLLHVVTTSVTMTVEGRTKRRTFGPDTEPRRFRQVDGNHIVATLAAACFRCRYCSAAGISF